MRIVAIVNPVSGAGMDVDLASQRTALIASELATRGLTAAVYVTERAGHARELASRAVAEGADLVLVWGGDGTVNEAGGALLNTATALGLIPAGSGNGLAGSLGTPRAPRAAIARALDAQVRAIDAGVCGGRPFFNIAGIGFDAHIARLFTLRPRGRRGRWPYVTIGIREGVRYAGRRYEMSLDGAPHASTALLMAFANGREYGMGVQIAPGAKLDDGLLEACIVEDRTVLARFWDARHLALGSVARAPRTVLRPVREAQISAEGEIEFHVDGEPGVAWDRLEVTVLPAALRVRA